MSTKCSNQKTKRTKKKRSGKKEEKLGKYKNESN